jgi:DNA topoisomerase-3
MPRQVAGRAVSAPLASVLLSRRRSAVLRGFRGKNKRRFAAALVLEDDGSLRFAFDGDDGGARASARARAAPRDDKTATPRKKATAAPRTQAKAAAEASATKRKTVAVEELRCPRCGQGTLIAGKRGWGCGRWRDGCSFVIWFETAGRRLTPAQLRDLIVRGQTRRARFRTDGSEVEGRLVLAPASDGGVRLVPG